ncbi:MAG: Mut7-C RNAse domain-containing protein [Thermoprotei archaeon]
MEKFAEIKFLTDGMLGKLTRFLRILGFDTIYFRGTNDNELLTISQKDNRILITRDRELHQRAIKMNIKSILITETSLKNQLLQIVSKLNISLDLDTAETRCPLCNTKLEHISKYEIKNKIPEKIFASHEEFWICKKCNKIYWMGSHWKSINKTILSVNSSLSSLKS